MRPDQCVGADATKPTIWETDEDERAAAWHSVFEEMLKRNPTFTQKANKGIECALTELRRLYAIEARFALSQLRGEEWFEGDAGK